MLLYAPNIHQGGGRALLLPLLQALKDDANVCFALDERMNLPEGLDLAGKVFLVSPTLFSRLKFEWQLSSWVTDGMKLLCMGNLPPLFCHNGEQLLFVQNRYLVENVSLASFGLPVRLRLMVERWWLKSRIRYVKRIIVQTPTMQQLLKESLDRDSKALAFAPAMDTREVPAREKKYDFLYVASGEPHKNHKKLVEAWIELAGKGIFPHLCLTITEQQFPELFAWLSGRIREHYLKISIVEKHSHDEVLELYHLSRALVFPSLFESFGLPLVEAVAVGLPVLASDCDYVMDVIIPSATFDASSSHSIADSVVEFSYKPSSMKIKLLDANEFLAQAFQKEQDA